MTYINMRSSYGVETVDSFESRREAKLTIKEYRLADRANHYYLSQRCTNQWRTS